MPLHYTTDLRRHEGVLAAARSGLQFSDTSTIFTFVFLDRGSGRETGSLNTVVVDLFRIESRGEQMRPALSDRPLRDRKGLRREGDVGEQLLFVVLSALDDEDERPHRLTRVLRELVLCLVHDNIVLASRQGLKAARFWNIVPVDRNAAVFTLGDKTG